MSDFVVVPAEGVSVGIDSSLIERVIAPAEWGGAPPIDLLAAVGLKPAAKGEPRVVVLRGERALRIDGKLTVRTIDDGRVQPLPRAVLGGTGARTLGGIVFQEGEIPLLVISVEGLA